MEITIEQSQKILLLENEIANKKVEFSRDQVNVSFGEIIHLYQNQEFLINSGGQNIPKWTLFQKTSFIESLLLILPIPPIIVWENEDGIWELVDGFQRINTVLGFLGYLKQNEYPQNGEFQLQNKWVLEEGELIKNLKGFTVDTLPSRQKLSLKRASCQIEILRGEVNTSFRKEIFKRFNSNRP